MDSELVFDYLNDVLTLTQHIAQSAWMHFVSRNDALLLDWCRSSSKSCLFISVLPNGTIQASLTYPADFKCKITYFMKSTQFPLKANNFKRTIIWGEFSPVHTIDTLQTWFNDILLPCLSNVQNRSGWTNDTSQDIDNNLQNLRAALTDIRSVNRTTVELYISPNLETVLQMTATGLDHASVEQKNSVYSSVIKWGHQLNDILTHDRDAQFDLNVATLYDEYEYWRNRFRILNHTHIQLNSDKLQRVGMCLDVFNSVYSGSFQSLIGQCTRNLNEAKDICVYLNPLENRTNMLRTSDFENTTMHIRPLLQCMSLMAADLKWFTASDWQRLLQMLCNLIVAELVRQLDAASMFQSDEEEQVNRLAIAVDLLMTLMNEIKRLTSRLHPHHLPTNCPPWRFLLPVVFSRIRRFGDRLHTLRDILQTAVEFGRLDCIEFGGKKGKMISEKLMQTMHSYRKEYNRWSTIEFDVLDVDGEGAVAFERFRCKYEQQIDAFERTLAQLFVAAFDDCYTTDHGIKFIEAIGPLLTRKIIWTEVESSLNRIGQLYLNDVLNVQQLIIECEHNTSLEEPQLHTGFPMISAKLIYLDQIRKRLHRPLRDMPYLHLKFNDISSDGMKALNLQHLLVNQLTSMEKYILDTWLEGVEQIVSTTTCQPLIRVGEDNRIVVNFNNSLMEILQTLRTINRLGIMDLRSDYMDLFTETNQTWDTLIILNDIAKCYNYIRTQCTLVELNIVREQLHNIDHKLKHLRNRDTWIQHDVSNLRLVNKETTSLFQRITMSHSNICKYKTQVCEWTSIPLYQRTSANEPLDMRNIERIFQTRVDLIESSRVHVQALIEDNIRILFNVVQENNSAKTDSIESVTSQKRKRFQTFIGLTHKVLYNFKNTTNETKPSAPPQLEQNENAMQSDEHKPYADYVRNIMIHAILDSAYVSMNYLSHQFSNSTSALCVVLVRLRSNHIEYCPSVLREDEGVTLMLDQVLHNICASVHPFVGICCPCEHPIHANEPLAKIKEDLMSVVHGTLMKVRIFAKDLNTNNYIWMAERSKHSIGHMTTSEIKREITKWTRIYEKTNLQCQQEQIFDGWISMDMREFKQSLLNECGKWRHLFLDALLHRLTDSLRTIDEFIKLCTYTFSNAIPMDNLNMLLQVMALSKEVYKKNIDFEATVVKPLIDDISMLRKFEININESLFMRVGALLDQWNQVLRQTDGINQSTEATKSYHMSCVLGKINAFEKESKSFRGLFQESTLMMVDCPEPYVICDYLHNKLVTLEITGRDIANIADLFGLNPPDFAHIISYRNELDSAKVLWDYVHVANSCIDHWMKTPWSGLDIESIEQNGKQMAKEIRCAGKFVQNTSLYCCVDVKIRNLLTALRSVTALKNEAIQDRHWFDLLKLTGLVRQFEINFLTNLLHDSSTTLGDLLLLNLHEFEDDVKSIVDRAIKEKSMQKTLDEIVHTWQSMHFNFTTHERSGLALLHPSDKLVETLEDHQVQVNAISNSKYIAIFEDDFKYWSDSLSRADNMITLWTEAQRKWIYLESIFIRSEDLRMQLPEHTKAFDRINEEFRLILLNISRPAMNVIQITNQVELTERIDRLLIGLAEGEQALNDYLERKRKAYPRFYFIATVDLLDILSNNTDPKIATRHLPKLYDSISKLNMVASSTIGQTAAGTTVQLEAHGFYSKEHDEYVAFNEIFICAGNIELWLNRITIEMRKSLRSHFQRAIEESALRPQEKWILDWSAQTALCITQIWWSVEVNVAFENMQVGYESAMRDYQRKLIAQLSTLIGTLLGELRPGDRQRIMTICTIQVHSRDIVSKIISQRIDSHLAFQWQSQLRHRWDHELNECFANICDAQFQYQYEYLGNTPRLVVTPLTDRCYITLTQSLHLIMGGAPSGPAGTGKTETTKDLGKGLGVMVYVFNCSEQLDYRSCAMIYKGLAQTGAWGCFDEFNRISIDVLSVVAVQVKCILDALKRSQIEFDFMGDRISLVPSVGLFVTMNPGYAGRTELPENLKALFRPCAMVVPDFALICEIMLVAEGFQEARTLARKFISLYTLCKQLLSAQDHYDWGLRAIKSVLVVAGRLRRSDNQKPEEQVLMRALRDFNLSKIVCGDVAVFLGLINDLFPLLDVPRESSQTFDCAIRAAAQELRLQPEDGFVLKVVQLQELLAVRHSVFVVGEAGTGKSSIWKTLIRTLSNQGEQCLYNDLNPKGVTNNELYGIINPTTREWRDGLLSKILREHMNSPVVGLKLLVLDGDIDPLWIESLNTVMDDNKVLTLARNERIALTTNMRLLFEVGDLKYATPATISRAGILYLNSTDLTWQPYITSWIESRANDSQNTTFHYLFEKYLPRVIQKTKDLKRITPISDISMVQMTCLLLDSLLPDQHSSDSATEEWLETCVIFAIQWGFGSTYYQDQMIDWQSEFNRFWRTEFPCNRKLPDDNIYGYFIDTRTQQLQPWSALMQRDHFEPDLNEPLQTMLVPTVESIRIKWFLDQLLVRNVPIMLIGAAGTGKSVIVNEQLNALPDRYQVVRIPFNFYTSSESLQKALEEPLEKKAGCVFAPSCYKRVVYFIDDLNMPSIDSYGTVQSHQIIRQYMDYQHWYDRVRLTLRDVQHCQFIASMNPSAGTFRIDPRLQRHFCTFAVNAPDEASLFHIYQTILSHHLSLPWNRFSTQHIKQSATIVAISLAVHYRVSVMFLPTAAKFHYIFNLRDLSNIYQGMMFAQLDTCPEPDDLIRLYLHEASRVYSDKLISESDLEHYRKMLREVLKKQVDREYDEKQMFREPLIYCHFGDGLAEAKYMPIAKWEDLIALLTEANRGYNEMIGPLSLVLFEDAMAHICRINRIFELPRGNVILVGVGGSGKQSLARLASFISNLTVSQIQLRRGYSVFELRAHLNAIYTQVGLKNIQTMFLMTDAQIPDESFLVVINDLLASAEVSDMFTVEEIDSIHNAVRNEVKQLGLSDSKSNCWTFFLDKIKHGLKVVLCFSPVGPLLRQRARKFPAIMNGTMMDWFHEWPRSALESVSTRFLKSIDVLPTELVVPISVFMSLVLESVKKISHTYLAVEKRYYYTTPKSYLESISLYSKLLCEKNANTQGNIRRLENGLVKLSQCAEMADSLKRTLYDQKRIMAEKNLDADKLIVIVGAENEVVQREKLFAADEERRVRLIEEEVQLRAKLCAEDLRKAEPALQAAQMALNTLNKTNLTELKSFGAPPPAVVKVCAAVLVLCSGKHKMPRDRSWKACKQMIGAVDRFLGQLMRFDKEHIPAKVIAALQPYLSDPEFEPQTILSKSVAASGLCAWVINIHKFYTVYQIVGPKQTALKEAQIELAIAQAKLSQINEKIKAIETKWIAVQQEFEMAVCDKNRYQREAEQTGITIDLANRLVTGLSTEALRWHQSVETLRSQMIKLPGDMLFVASFVAYVGGFTRRFRLDLIENVWKPALKEIKPTIPISSNLGMFEHYINDVQIAEWNNEGLPTDRMSTENAIIFIKTQRWPLLIDPQLQGLKWIKRKFGDQLVVTNPSKRNYLDIIEGAITLGQTVLLENIGETLDAVLEPLLCRTFVKRGAAIRIGDKEVDYSKDFKMILHTKLANPHYMPELQAQTTLINFTVTRDGLEDQLLAEVVKVERPDLETSKSQLTEAQNRFKIKLNQLEYDLLERLSTSGENILADPKLVLNLEETKKIADDVEQQVRHSRESSMMLDETREVYRAVATRASILYFVLNDLFKINPMYQFSLKSFVLVFKRAIANQILVIDQPVAERVQSLIDSITFEIFIYTCRGLFERDKPVFAMQMVLQISSGTITDVEKYFFLKCPPPSMKILSPVDFLSDRVWGAVHVLSAIDGFAGLDKAIINNATRWRAYFESDVPEKERSPGEWGRAGPFQRLMLLRCLRPDRVIYGAWHFIEETMGTRYVERRMIALAESFLESSSTVPILFILSPGVDPLLDVEKLGQQLGFCIENANFHNVSLGQGQETVAERVIGDAQVDGHWVVLQNVHLVAKWLSTLDKQIEDTDETEVHTDYRLFISAEPAPSVTYHIIPQGILESSIKITNEPPTGMRANIHRALDNFSQDTMEMCTKETEFKSILFALCFFHSILLERRKFGAQGWNIEYPFNIGDLTISVYVLYNYLETHRSVPWEDLRYLVGEIMYGGHITDDWDRRLCRTYLSEFLQEDLIDDDLKLCNGFVAPSNNDYKGYHAYVRHNLPAESPILYGMHANSEIDFLTSRSDQLLDTIFELQSVDGGSSLARPDGRTSAEDMVKLQIDEYIEKIPDEFCFGQLNDHMADGYPSPYVVVVIQETQRMTLLLREIRRSLRELLLGLRGELNMSSGMEALHLALVHHKVPGQWEALAYPSQMELSAWYNDLTGRHRELNDWLQNLPTLPVCVRLGGLFNPQSFLTAIMQSTARKHKFPLDRMCLNVDVTGKWCTDYSCPPKDGAYVHRFFMEGARWDILSNSIATAIHKELYAELPVIHVKASTQDKLDTRNVYECPIYRTKSRGGTYIWTFNLKTRDNPSKWTLGGVALLLQT